MMAKSETPKKSSEVKERKQNTLNESILDYTVRNNTIEAVKNGELKTVEEVHKTFIPTESKPLKTFPKFDAIREYLDSRNSSSKDKIVEIDGISYVIDYVFEELNTWIILNDEKDAVKRQDRIFNNDRVKAIMGGVKEGGVDVKGDPILSNGYSQSNLPIVSLLTIQPWHDLQKMLKYLKSRTHNLSRTVYPRNLTMKYYPSMASGLPCGVVLQKPGKNKAEKVFEIFKLPADYRKRLFDFIDEEHLLGWDNPRNRGVQEFITLEDVETDEIYSIMTFGAPSKSAARSFMGLSELESAEATRFCNKNGVHIPGAGSKMLTAWERLHPELKKVFTYSDCSLSRGDLYAHQGYKLKEIQRGDFKFYSKVSVSSSPKNKVEDEFRREVIVDGKKIFINFLDGKKLKETSLHLQGSDRLLGAKNDSEGNKVKFSGFSTLIDSEEIFSKFAANEVDKTITLSEDDFTEYINLGVDCVCGGLFGCHTRVNNNGREILVTKCLISSDREMDALGFLRYADSGNYIYVKELKHDGSSSSSPLEALKNIPQKVEHDLFSELDDFS